MNGWPKYGYQIAMSVRKSRDGLMGERLRVLIVEDNPDTANSLQIVLKLLGFEARVAYTGPEGVEATHAFRPDVVVCDIGLPGLNGWDVAHKVRADPATAATRFIALSGYSTDEDRRRSQEAGFECHLVKPVDVDDLLPLLTRK
jgi:CheY-like chemotaxis protein